MLGGAWNLAVGQTAQLAVGAVTDTIQVGNNPIGVAMNPAGTTAYVTNFSQGSNNGTVSVIDTASNTVTATITVGANPVGVALNPAGTLAYVTNNSQGSSNGTVSVIDTANDANQNTVIATIQVGTNPVGMALNPAGTLAYVVNNSNGSSNGTVSVIDTANDTNQNTVIATIPVGPNPAYVALNSTGTLVYVTLDDPSVSGGGGGFTVIDTATNTVTGGIATGDYAIGVALNPTGGLAYVVDSGDNDLAVIGIPANQSFQLLATIPVGTGADPTFVAVNSAGTYAYVTDSGNGTISVISTVTNTVTSIPVGNLLPQAVALNPSGTLAYVTLYGSPMVSGGSAVAVIALSGTNFGSVNVGSSSTSPVPLVFTFNSGGQIGAPVVLTHGAANLDFTDAGTGSCTTNGTSHVYVAGDSCVVNVTFTPTAPGGRYGAAELTDSLGNAIATGYVQGTGVGPQVSFPPGVQSTIGSGLNRPSNVAVDASGNVYIADTGNSRVLRETLSGGSYSQSTIGSGFNAPTGVAVDWSGNVYIADNGTGLAYKETPSPNGYMQSTISSSPLNLSSIAVDESGNVFLADAIAGAVFEDALSSGSYTQKVLIAGLADIVGLTVDGSGNLYGACTCNGNGNASNAVIKETLLFGGGYSQSVLDSGFSDAAAIAVDGLGNVYVADSGAGTVYQETLSGGSYTRSTIATTGSMEPNGVAVDGSGNVFFAGVSQSGTGAAFKLDFADAPSLSFATTTFGTTSTDSPQTVTVANVGNAALSFPILSTGTNPNAAASFVLDNSGTCPVVNAGASSPGTLAAGSTCDLAIDFVPATAGAITGSVVLTDNAYAPAQNYATQTILLNGTATYALPTVTGLAPQSGPSIGGTTVTITGSSLLGATAVYFGAIPAASFTVIGSTSIAATAPASSRGTVDVTVTTQGGTSAASLADEFTYQKGTPTVSAWPTASAITYGQTLALSTLTGGTATVAGTFAWTTSTTAPATGTTSYSVTFTPTDTTDYSVVTGTVGLTVNMATPTVSAWPTASAITYGQTLASSTLTGGAATVAGTFAWTTSTTIPAAGTASYSVTFMPTDATDYSTVIGTVSATVNKAMPTVSAWPTASAITYGQTLASSTLTGGTASVAGTFAWTTSTTAPATGTASYSATFTPTDTTDYSVVTGTLSLTVNKAAPTVSTWPTASAITYGQTLASSMLTGGTASVAGTFAWTTSTTAPTVGTASNSVTFTPTDAVDYTTATAMVSLLVNQAKPTISWATPAAISYGTTLGTGQLDATASVAGTFIYSPGLGAVLGAGTQTLTATFTPTDAVDYMTVTTTVSIAVSQATPTISWATPAAISYGTPLGTAQLNATASVAGTFIYSPAAGTVLSPGPQKLTVSFTPTDGTDFTTASATAMLNVGNAAPAISLISSDTSIFVSNPVTFTASVVSSVGTPTGTVSFLDGTTLLATAVLSNGQAIYTTSGLAAGTHAIVAIYSGDANFSALTSAAITEAVEDFTIGASSGASTSATASPGGQAAYTLAITPPSGQVLVAPITLTVTGLPTGATATFSPASIAAGTGATNVTLTVQLPSSTAKAEPTKGLFGGGIPVALGLILLPFLNRRRRAQLGRMGCWILAGIGSAVLFAALAGCGGISGRSGSGSQPQDYTLTVTATSGSLSNAATLSLTVE